MNRFTGLFVAVVFGITMAWAQAPAPQNGAAPAAAPAQAAAPSQQASVSGCMTQYFGQFSVADAGSSKSWQVKGAGARLWDHENHVVKIQGLPDPQAASPVVYALSMQDTGQPCGSAQAANAAPALNAGPAASATSAQPEAQQQPGGGISQPSTPTAPNSAASTPQATTPQTPAQQGGVSGAATNSPATPAQAAGENKGTPTAGTPAEAVAAPPAQQQPADSNHVFSGCLNGTINNYQFKANGKVYRLQGNTMSLGSMLNHQVEITGEDFNGKAIQVNGARDLGGNCKGK